jgi:hypothetical protein
LSKLLRDVSIFVWKINIYFVFSRHDGTNIDSPVVVQC